tara:strand:+ start:587 stop:784 length:198 start_codon:yes stop_codon:yes gene_type:complete
LRERIFFENHSKNVSSLWFWLKKGKLLKKAFHQNQEHINLLIQSLEFDDLLSENQLNPKSEDIAE